MAVPFARVRTTADRLYVNSRKSKLLSIMSFRGFRVWYYDLNFIFCRILRHFAVDGSQVTYKRNNDCMAEFQIRCSTLALFWATRFCRKIFQKTSVFSMWRRSDRCDTRTARALVSRETIVSVTLNMLISLLKRQIPAVQKKAKRILCGGAWNGFFDGEEAVSKYLSD